ncbi:MAG: hypothetical protein M5U12_20845 [Verrucomicrobia bacterium]|nr:hypothetical protein [Verrucomicrobiota bacterium]
MLRSFERDVPKAAAHLQRPEAKMHAAVAYATAFPAEIEDALADAPDPYGRSCARRPARSR